MSLGEFSRGVILVFALNALALGAALAVALRAKLGGRGELAVATAVLWNALVMAPVYALGLGNRLYPRTLAWVSTAWFVAVYLAARGPDNAFERELGRAAWSLVRLPFSAVRESVKARSLVAFAVVFTMAMLAWGFACAYFTPSWRQWDALWYHEPIVGFTLQNHGFSVIDLPMGGPQKINGYPRLCEMTQLWFVIFTDRRTIDMVGYIAAPMLAASVYVMARRYTSRVVSIGLGCALVLMPACAMILGTTYVDAHNAAFVLAGAHFATRPQLRLRDAGLAAVALALAGASKHMAAVPVLVLSVITAARVLARARGRWAASTATVLGGAALITGAAAVTYVRNWIHFHNPLWPDFQFDSDRFGIHWPGMYQWKSGEYELGENRLDMNMPLGTFLEDLYRIPYSVLRGHMTQTYEYGIGIAWVVAPLTVVALLALACGPILDLLGLLLNRPSLRPSPESRNASLIAITLVPVIYFTPALWSARYQIAAVGLALVLVAWAVGRREHLADNVAGALSIAALASFFWTTPRWWLWWSEAKALAAIPYPEREFTPAREISPDLDMHMGSPITKEAGLAREKLLGPGATLAFSDNYSTYMALFWNNEFSNRVLWVPDGPDFFERLMATDATWVYCAMSDPHLRTLQKADSGWVQVAPLQVEHWGYVFRRTQW